MHALCYDYPVKLKGKLWKMWWNICEMVLKELMYNVWYEWSVEQRTCEDY